MSETKPITILPTVWEHEALAMAAKKKGLAVEIYLLGVARQAALTELNKGAQ